ncbi:hypothetical protein ACIRON_15645 [Nocardioides sp. NPDC101246]|uniref:AbiTii domain-containing protein n=1 Tax=Nocardioides sp. NPDC101246 TaxID=3364336 RepID=UPI0037FC57ED
MDQIDQTGPSLDLLAALEDDIFSNVELASTLRKCVILGGRAGSTDLRDWATSELTGYENDDEAPDCRRAAAPIMIDATIGNGYVKGQVISANILPEPAREFFSAGPIFLDGIAAIEAMVEETRGQKSYRMSHAGAMDICAQLDKESGNPFQQITGLYWSISHSSLVGIVDAVRTRLAQIVAEMRTHTPVGQPTPTAEVASDAVRRIIAMSARTSRG